MTNEAFHPDFTHLPAIAQDAARYFFVLVSVQHLIILRLEKVKKSSPYSTRYAHKPVIFMCS